MRVLVLDTLLDQTNEKKIPPDVLPRLYNEYRELARLEREGYNALYEYLTTGNNGKRMEGITDLTIFKYRLTKGDRILYTYGKYLPYLHKEKDSIVLLGYATHDEQGFFAKHTDFRNVAHKFEYLNSIVRELNKIGNDLETLSEEGLYNIASLIVANCFKGYAYTDEELAQFSTDEIDKHLILSNEQKDVITSFQSRNSPTLIMGGAGTGKTLIAIHMLNNVAANKEKPSIAYFTQSKILLQKVKDQFEQLKSDSLKNDSSNIEFCNINEHCLKSLPVRAKQVVGTRHFIDVFMGQKIVHTLKGVELLNELQNQEISYDNVWTEIRGTIKGGMQNWTRVSPMNQDEVSVSISNLVKEHYIERLENNKKCFVLTESVVKTTDRMKRQKDMLPSDKTALTEILHYYSTFHADLKAIDDSYYLSIKDENSLLSVEQRKLILEVYHEYERYLDDNHLYDENDLIRLAIQSDAYQDSVYDFIFVDEVQDYTELQLYYIYKLAGNKNGIVYAGDVHQIINPTLFSPSKLKELFREENQTSKLKEEFLTTNFRCQKGIIDVVNELSGFRRSILGSQASEMEQPERSNVSICLYDPYRLAYSKKNVSDIMAEIVKYPQVAVLVPDSKTKERLAKLVETADRPEFIFTVEEIKGMEYDYVVCYNMISDYQDQWNSITLKNINNERTKYRYYFNLLYVAITRARKLLCMIDEQTVPILEDVLKLRKEDIFDPDLFHFSDLDNSLSAWLQQAHEYKNQGKYKIALQYYEKAKAHADIRDIYDCHIGAAEEKYDYETAVKYCMLQLSRKYSRHYKEQLESFSNQLEKSSSVKVLADFLLDKNLEFGQLAAAIEMEFRSFSNTERENISRMFLEQVELILMEKLGRNRIPKV